MKKVLLSVLIVCGVWSAQAAIFQYSVSLSGPNESPVNASPGIGSGTVNYDNVSHLLQLQVTFSGLIQTNGAGGTTASHLHAATVNPFSGTAGVATTTPSFAGFPLGVFGGSFSNTLDLTLASSWNPAFVTANGTIAGAENALANAMAGGQAYWNIHSASIPGGEIRGFLVAVPEPSSLALAGLGVAAFATRMWCKRRANTL
jgi:hypothetical protein